MTPKTAQARFAPLLSLVVAALFQLQHVQARSVPQNLKNFVASVRNNGTGQCQDVFAGGFHSQTGDSGNFDYCGDYYDKYGIIYLQGPHGKLVNMDIDCDGNQNPHRPGNDGRCGPSKDTQNQTSFGYIAAGYPGVKIKELNAFVHTYTVFGNVQNTVNFYPQRRGIHPLSIMAVVCPSHGEDKLVYGVWGDQNGGDGPPLVGEASIGLATLCYGEVVNGNNGHSPNNVMFIAFNGSRAVPGPSADWNAKSAQAFEASLEKLGNELVATIGS